MGKIRTKVLGNEELEKKQKEQAKIKAEQKKFVKGAKGGERVVSVGPSEEELAQLEVKEETKGTEETKGETPKKKTVRQKKTKERARSKGYQIVAQMVDRKKTYPLSQGLELLEKLKRAKFDETVELHINTLEAGINATVTLPHGTGKTIRVAIADEKIIAEVEKGKINFDVLIAEPGMMPKLAKVARFLGPRGLMPNPKSGTISNDPQKLAQNFSKGQIHVKTEAKAPIIHLTVGKLSFGPKKLSENIESIVKTVKKERIKNVTLKSTFSPGIKLAI